MKARVWVDEMDKLTSAEQNASGAQGVVGWIKQRGLNSGREQWVIRKH